MSDVSIKRVDVRAGGDHVAVLKEAETRSQNKLIEVESVRNLRNKLIVCHRQAGVNHYEDCRALVKSYLDAIKQL